MSSGKFAGAFALILAAVATWPAAAADYYRTVPQGQVYDNVRPKVPECNDPRVLAKVEDQFEYGAPRVLHAPLSIVEFSALQEKAYFPSNDIRTVERRYCQGQALVTGGDYKGVTTQNYFYYVIEYPMGFASIGWRAEGCFLGYDAWLVYGANCQSLRRF
ncbi:hypothetical protein FPY71_06760 [Aureimonas fodinaquatilis]|uniref:DUF930 domain-containing protein n=1 Tax=Aureimonas fodinaquatilis TaxID=2565783 RepID=A0A5B0DV60_9HYPH|nr:hypothetical protein [Aureimonas fodinaquatilis]KAA0970228.1 hypothetical protein FPY71_06760 [Aureimonas fodinaquatilis]